MYYVKTETENYSIVTSYATKYQAEKYAEVWKTTEMHLLAGEDGHIIEAPEYNHAGDFEDLGRVRTIFRSRTDAKEAGRFMLYSCSIDEDGKEFWTYAGISFQAYKDANRFLKSKSLVCFGDMAIVENPHIKQSWNSEGDPDSVDLS